MPQKLFLVLVGMIVFSDMRSFAINFFYTNEL